MEGGWGTTRTGVVKVWLGCKDGRGTENGCDLDDGRRARFVDRASVSSSHESSDMASFDVLIK